MKGQRRHVPEENKMNMTKPHEYMHTHTYLSISTCMKNQRGELGEYKAKARDS